MRALQLCTGTEIQEALQYAIAERPRVGLIVIEILQL